MCWILLALIFRFAENEFLIFTSILSGPCVVLLTYFAFGGEVPLKFRRKGFRWSAAIAMVFWISLAAAIVVKDFFLHGLE